MEEHILITLTFSKYFCKFTKKIVISQHIRCVFMNKDLRIRWDSVQKLLVEAGGNACLISIERIMRKHGSIGIFRACGKNMNIFMGSILTGKIEKQRLTKLFIY